MRRPRAAARPRKPTPAIGLTPPPAATAGPRTPARFRGPGQASGGSDSGYTVQSPSTLNPDGSWTTTGVASSSGSGSGSWSYSGSAASASSSSYGNADNGSASSSQQPNRRELRPGLGFAVHRPVHPGGQRLGDHHHDGLRLRDRLGNPKNWKNWCQVILILKN